MKGDKVLWLSLFLMAIGMIGILVMSRGLGFGYGHSMMGMHRMSHGGMFGGGRSYPEGIGVKDLPDSGSEGARLFISYCTQCHVLPNPGSHNASEWPSVVDRMESNIKALGRRLFTESERKEITRYLVTHASSKP